jgi:adhesin/invasin
MDVLSGDQQQGVVASELPKPVVVKVLDAGGRPVQGQAVNFRVTSGGGSVFAGASVTSAEGLAQERWTLGTVAGAEQTLEARAVDNSTGGALVFSTFHATATAGAASSLFVVTQPGTATRVAEPLFPQPVVRLVDKFANPVKQAGIPVIVGVLPSAEHAMDGHTSVQTDVQGVATFTDLSIRGSTGPVTLAFSAPDVPTAASSEITLTPGQVRSLLANGSSAVSDTVAAVVAPTLLPSVVAKDGAGNVVAGAIVVFTAEANSGLVSTDGSTFASTASSTTNAAGVATLAGWKLPTTAGIATVRATAAEASVPVTATVRSGNPKSLFLVTPPSPSLQSGVPAPAQPTVRLRDQFGNFASESGVVVTVTSSAPYSISGTASATTDQTGTASFTGLAVAGPPGEVVLSFAASHLQPVASGSLSVQAPTFDRTPYLQVVSGIGQTGRVTTGLTDPFVVQVVDSSGAAMRGVDVHWEGPGGGAVSPVWTVSDVNGLAKTYVTTLPTFSGVKDGIAQLAADATGARLVRFPTTITPDAPAKLLKTSGDQQSAMVGQMLSAPLGIQLVDQYNNGVLGVATDWRASDGGSVTFVTPNGVTAGISGPGTGGVVQARWLLGAAVGPQTLAVTAGSLSQTFSATATPGPGVVASLRPGDPQSAPVGTSVDVSVTALDGRGTAVPGVVVAWAIASGGGSVISTSATDATGVGRATVVLPTTPGPVSVQATVPSVPSVSPASISLYATDGRPGRGCRVVLLNSGVAGDRGDPTDEPLRVAVYDSLSNPVGHVDVGLLFYVNNSWDSPGRILSVTSDAIGLSSVGGETVLGSGIGNQEIDIRYPKPCGWNGPFNAAAIGFAVGRATPATLLRNTSSSLAAAPGTILELAVYATERHGFYAPGATLEFRVTSGDGVFNGGHTVASLSTSTIVGTAAPPGYARMSYVVGYADSQVVTVSGVNVSPLVLTIRRTP